MKAYVASSLDNADEARAIAEALGLDGWTITYRWFEHGSVQADGEARIREVARAELDGVLQAELVVVALPGARGTHVELGVALGVMAVRHEIGTNVDFGPRAIVIYGRAEEAFERYASSQRWGGTYVDVVEQRRLAGAVHDHRGRTCAFYLAPGVHLVEKDRGLDGLRLEALRVAGVAPKPKTAVAAAEVAPQ